MYFTPAKPDSTASGHSYTFLQAKITDFTPANPDDNNNPESLIKADLLFVKVLQEWIHFSALMNLQKTSKYMTST